MQASGDGAARRRTASERTAPRFDRAEFPRIRRGQRAHHGRPNARHLRGDARRSRPAMDARPRHRLDHRGVRDAAASDARAHRAREHQRPPRRPHARDSALDRPRAARRYRHASPRRTHDLGRLRRHPGRRRNAHGRDHRRICRDRARTAQAVRPASTWPLRAQIAATSVGIVEDRLLLDLAYTEDSRAEVDMNVAMTSHGELVEVQGTAEAQPFSRSQARRDARPRGSRYPRAIHGASPRHRCRESRRWFLTAAVFARSWRRLRNFAPATAR